MNGAPGATVRTLAGEYGIGFAPRLGRVGASGFDVFIRVRGVNPDPGVAVEAT